MLKKKKVFFGSEVLYDNRWINTMKLMLQKVISDRRVRQQHHSPFFFPINRGSNSLLYTAAVNRQTTTNCLNTTIYALKNFVFQTSWQRIELFFRSVFCYCFILILSNFHNCKYKYNRAYSVKFIQQFEKETIEREKK